MNSTITKKEIEQINTRFFKIIRITEYYVELKSRSTKHCWIIQRHPLLQEKYPIYLYHKHNEKDNYYHRHWQTYTFKQALNSIKSHDKFVLDYPDYLLQKNY